MLRQLLRLTPDTRSCFRHWGPHTEHTHPVQPMSDSVQEAPIGDMQVSSTEKSPTASQSLAPRRRMVRNTKTLPFGRESPPDSLEMGQRER